MLVPAVAVVLSMSTSRPINVLSDVLAPVLSKSIDAAVYVPAVVLVTFLSMAIVPTTSNSLEGASVPIPTLESETISVSVPDRR